MFSVWQYGSFDRSGRMTKFNIDNSGWLHSAEVIRSPNFDGRPADAKIKLIVVHGISLPPGEFGGGHIQQFFCNRLERDAHEYFAGICDMRVSAHCLVERTGNVVQFVSFLDRAWHAGESEWRGEAACNDFSVGIELEGCDDLAYTEAQYQSLRRWCAIYAGLIPISSPMRSRGIATSRRRARPIPGRRSTGESSAGY